MIKNVKGEYMFERAIVFLNCNKFKTNMKTANNQINSKTCIFESSTQIIKFNHVTKIFNILYCKIKKVFFFFKVRDNVSLKNNKFLLDICIHVKKKV